MKRFNLAELQALPLPPCDIAQLKQNDRVVVVPADYWTAFLPLRFDAHDNPVCVGCGLALTGFLIGTFTWGLANGEGYCSHCGYPARAFHRFTYEDGSPTLIRCVLQYHPSVLAQCDEVDE
jgi:hypothetical protein